jgi:hypothetical protein
VGRDDDHLGDALHHRDHLEQVLPGPLGVGVAQELDQPGPLEAACQSFALPDQVSDQGVADVPRQGDEDDDAARMWPGAGTQTTDPSPWTSWLRGKPR